MRPHDTMGLYGRRRPGAALLQRKPWQVAGVSCDNRAPRQTLHLGNIMGCKVSSAADFLQICYITQWNKPVCWWSRKQEAACYSGAPPWQSGNRWFPLCLWVWLGWCFWKVLRFGKEKGSETWFSRTCSVVRVHGRGGKQQSGLSLSTKENPFGLLACTVAPQWLHIWKKA